MTIYLKLYIKKKNIYIYSFYCKMNYIYEDDIYFLLKKKKNELYILSMNYK